MKITEQVGFVLAMTYIALRLHGLRVPDLFSAVLIGVAALLLHDRVMELRQS